MFNASYRKTGVIRFLKLGRFNVSFCLSRPTAQTWASHSLSPMTIGAIAIGMVIGTALYTFMT